MKNDTRSYDRNFCNCVKKPEKNSGLQRGLRSRVQAPLKSWIFFRLLYAIAKIAIITARIILHLIGLTADFCYVCWIYTITLIPWSIMLTSRPFGVSGHMVQKPLAGEHIVHWDIQNKENLNQVLLFWMSEVLPCSPARCFCTTWSLTAKGLFFKIRPP